MNDKDFIVLSDYLDGALDDAERTQFEARLASDAGLRDELEALRAMRADARALSRSVEPNRDLWPDIAARIGAERRGTIDFGRYRRARLPLGRYLVAAAVVLLAIGLPYLFSAEPDPPASESRETAGLPADPEFQRVATQYLSARDELLALLESRKEEIAPETYAVVEENLTVIANAVTEIETALAAQPESERLERMLYAAYRSEVNLLKQAVQLSEVPSASNGSETKQGDNHEG